MPTIPMELMNDREIVETANKLARKFAEMQGYEVPDDFKFYDQTDSGPRPPVRVVRCWQMAECAFEMLRGTEVQDALNAVLEDEEMERQEIAAAAKEMEEREELKRIISAELERIDTGRLRAMAEDLTEPNV